jgi:hypothetical protein
MIYLYGCSVADILVLNVSIGNRTHILQENSLSVTENLTEIYGIALAVSRNFLIVDTLKFVNVGGNWDEPKCVTVCKSAEVGAIVVLILMGVHKMWIGEIFGILVIEKIEVSDSHGILLIKKASLIRARLNLSRYIYATLIGSDKHRKPTYLSRLSAATISCNIGFPMIVLYHKETNLSSIF